MGKEFVEYQNERGTIPYPASTLCFRLTKYAQEYILNNRKNISNIDPNVRDAVLTDAINYLGAQGYCDFRLYTKDLYKSEEHTFYVEPDCLITAAFRRFSYYMFNYDMVESVLRNNHMNECREEFDVNDGLTVLLDFVNFITEKNDYDRVFTLNDFYESAKKQEQSFKLRQLKYFLEHTSKYSERLQNQENIDDIFDQMAKNNDLKYISNKPEISILPNSTLLMISSGFTLILGIIFPLCSILQMESTISNLVGNVKYPLFVLLNSFIVQSKFPVILFSKIKSLLLPISNVNSFSLFSATFIIFSNICSLFTNSLKYAHLL